MATSTHYSHTKQPRFVSPKPSDGKMMSGMTSPRTITLGNQTEAILRGMASGQSVTARGLLFTQTASQRKTQLPMMPAIKQSPTQPIRITRRKSIDLQPRYAANSANTSEDLLNASSSELKLMYDEATWRMYNLIQSARMEKQVAKAAPAPLAGSTDTDFLYDDSFFLHPNTPPPKGMMGLPVVSPEDESEGEELEECVFELDDM